MGEALARRAARRRAGRRPTSSPSSRSSPSGAPCWRSASPVLRSSTPSGRLTRRWSRSSRTTCPRRAPRSAVPGSARVLSIAAGVRIQTLEAALPDGVAVVRAMPNTPALVGAGAAAIAGRKRGLVRRPRLGRVDPVGGRCRRSSRGVAARRGHRGVRLRSGLRVPVRRGVDRSRRARRPASRHQCRPRRADPRRRLPACSPKSTDSPADLRAAVTSPGGTTAAALRVLESAGWTRRARRSGRGGHRAVA